jgi:hypothetical protein
MRTHRARAPLLAAVVAALLPAPLAAQAGDSLHAHRGFWIGVGVGTGRAQLDCQAGCGAPTPVPSTWKGGPGLGYQIALGGTPRHNFLLGGEIGGVTRLHATHDATVVWAMFVSQVYPVPRRGLFVRAGLGIGGATLTDESLGITSDAPVESTGAAVQAGVGYDVRVGGRFALSPMAQYVTVLADGSEATIRGRTYTGPKNPGAFLVGIGFHWY